MDRQRITDAQGHLLRAEKLLQEHLIREPDPILAAIIRDLQAVAGTLTALEPGYRLPEPWLVEARKRVFPQTQKERDDQEDKYYRTGTT